jgi:hypothetical protein
MALRSVIALAVSAFLLISTPALASQCLTIDGFHQTLMTRGIQSFGSKSAATAKMESVINQNRAKAGKEKIDASIVLVAYAQDEKKEIIVIVAVVDQNGCIIEETFTTLTPDMWLAFLGSSGVELEEFIPISGA